MNGGLPLSPGICRVIDYETTGFAGEEGAEVIEMASVDVRPHDLSFGRMWRSFARPIKGPIPPQTRAVHHIGPADVADAPPAAYLWKDLFAGLGADDPMVAHNADFERAFHGGNGRPWICTYRCALVLWPDAPAHNNQTLRYWLGLDDLVELFDPALASPPHRALPDAYVTAFILREMLRLRDPSELAAITAGPILLKTLSFGKHRGVAYADAPTDYLRWIMRSDLDRDVKHTAQHWLDARYGKGRGQQNGQ